MTSYISTVRLLQYNHAENNRETTSDPRNGRSRMIIPPENLESGSDHVSPAVLGKCVSCWIAIPDSNAVMQNIRFPFQFWELFLRLCEELVLALEGEDFYRTRDVSPDWPRSFMLYSCYRLHANFNLWRLFTDTLRQCDQHALVTRP